MKIFCLQGITKTPISKMGMKASDTAILTFEDVHVPLANTVGQEGQGFRYQMLQFQVRDRVSVHGFSLPDDPVPNRDRVSFCFN